MTAHHAALDTHRNPWPIHLKVTYRQHSRWPSVPEHRPVRADCRGSSWITMGSRRFAATPARPGLPFGGASASLGSFGVIPRPALGVGPQPLEVVEAADLLQEDVDDEVAVVHENPTGVVETLDAQRGGATGHLDLLLDLLGDRPHLTGIGPVG